MNKFYLDGERMQSADNAHAYLRDVLSLPQYYGENADALYDCLTDICTETELVLLRSDLVDARILKAIRNAAKRSPNLTLSEPGTYGI